MDDVHTYQQTDGGEPGTVDGQTDAMGSGCDGEAENCDDDNSRQREKYHQLADHPKKIENALVRDEA